jgi:hypothetical protein
MSGFFTLYNEKVLSKGNFFLKTNVYYFWPETCISQKAEPTVVMQVASAGIASITN